MRKVLCPVANASRATCIGDLLNLLTRVRAPAQPPGFRFSTEQGRVRFWDITTGKQVRELNAGGRSTLAPDGKLLVSAHRDKIAILDIKTGDTICEILDFYSRFGWTPNH